MSNLYRAFTDEDSVLDVPDVVALEQRIAAEGTPLKELMRRAGTATAQVVMDRVSADGKVVVLAGTGNNGGDGWVAADVLARAGYCVTLVTPRPADGLRAQPAAETAQEICALGVERGVKRGGKLGAEEGTEQGAESSAAQVSESGAPFKVLVLGESQREDLNARLGEASVVLDCILGTGFEGSDVREPYATWINCANAWRGGWAGGVGSVDAVGGAGDADALGCEERFLLAVDTPSGYSAQSGVAAQQCIRADATITMIVGKTGLVAEGADRFTGELLLAPLV